MSSQEKSSLDDNDFSFPLVSRELGHVMPKLLTQNYKSGIRTVCAFLLVYYISNKLKQLNVLLHKTTAIIC